MKHDFLVPVIIPVVVAAAISAPFVAAKPAPHTLARAGATSTDRVLIDKASAYLRGLTSAEAKFSQTDPRGAVTKGTFDLQRPGKARFAYDPPAGLTVVADGVNVNVYDSKLKTFDQYPLKQTPLALLLGQDVRLDRDTVSAQVTRDKDGFAVALRDTKKRAEGRLTLRFSSTPLALTGWTVTDAQGGETKVSLSALKTGVAASPNLFVLTDPHPHTIKP